MPTTEAIVSTDIEEPEFLTWRMVADQLAEALGRTIDGSDVVKGRADALRTYEYLKADDAESNLIAHARLELKLAGWYEPDPDGLRPDWWAESLIAAVAEFSHYGHSGGTAGAAIGMLEALLQFRPLGPLTSNPEEWQDVTRYADGTEMWQNRRDGRVFSHDKGETWYNIEDPRWRKRKPWNVRAWWWRRKIDKMRSSAPMQVPEEQEES